MPQWLKDVFLSLLFMILTILTCVVCIVLQISTVEILSNCIPEYIAEYVFPGIGIFLCLFVIIHNPEEN